VHTGLELTPCQWQYVRPRLRGRLGRLKAIHGGAANTACMPLLTNPSRRDLLRRVIRYGSVSAISSVTSLTILGVLVGVLGFPALWSNVIAIAIGTVPSFELNRRWVWSQSTRRSLLRQALPYCLLSFAGLILSSIAVHVAADATANATRLAHTAAVESANFGAYGVLWLFQFVLCDRILFSSKGDSTNHRTPLRHVAASDSRVDPAGVRTSLPVASSTGSCATRDSDIHHHDGVDVGCSRQGASLIP
jgi:putative flippase GtrA